MVGCFFAFSEPKQDRLPRYRDYRLVLSLVPISCEKARNIGCWTSDIAGRTSDIECPPSDIARVSPRSLSALHTESRPLRCCWAERAPWRPRVSSNLGGAHARDCGAPKRERATQGRRARGGNSNSGPPGQCAAQSSSDDDPGGGHGHGHRVLARAQHGTYHYSAIATTRTIGHAEHWGRPPRSALLARWTRTI